MKASDLPHLSDGESDPESSPDIITPEEAKVMPQEEKSLQEKEEEKDDEVPEEKNESESGPFERSATAGLRLT